MLRARLREQLLKVGLNGSSRSGSSQEKNQHRSCKPMPQRYLHPFLDAKLQIKRFARAKRNFALPSQCQRRRKLPSPENPEGARVVRAC
jgi:hypothetical protein